MIDFPSSPSNGQIFTSGANSWIWSSTSSQWKAAPVGFSSNIQRLSGDGVTTQFALSTSPISQDYLDVFITGLYQQKDTYTISGSTLIFSEAPPTGTNNIELQWSSTLDIGVPSDSSVTASKLASGAAVGNIGYTPVNKAGDSVDGNIVPAVTGTYDLGTTSLRWRNIYTNDLQLSNGIGDYTVVEGEEDLFLYNNKTNKTFKFALIEVDPSVVPPKAKTGVE